MELSTPGVDLSRATPASVRRFPDRWWPDGAGDNAYTRTEVVRGVDVGNDAPPETVTEVLTEIRDELVDLAGDVVASGPLVDDLDAALDELVAEGTVVEKPVATTAGQSSYYRLIPNEAHE